MFGLEKIEWIERQVSNLQSKVYDCLDRVNLHINRVKSLEKQVEQLKENHHNHRQRLAKLENKKDELG